MVNYQKNGAEAQGAEAQEVPQLTPEMIRTKLVGDLQLAIHCLDAIYRDPSAMDMLADLMYGRYMNAQNAKRNAQTQPQPKAQV